MSVPREDLAGFARRLFGTRGTQAYRDALQMARDYGSIGHHDGHVAWTTVANHLAMLMEEDRGRR
ncbi:MAG: hypothetical protein QNJ94_03765 [Alphaproteobacteria bacterium]|nr:hypothetical protein [Alphaproteobacteria bacterium]